MLYGGDAGQRRSLIFHQLQKQQKPFVLGVCPDTDTVTGIGHSTGNPKTRGEIVHKGPKTYTLDCAADEDFEPLSVLLIYE